MKKLILKSGLFRYVNRTSTPQENELDAEQWLKKQLNRLGVSYVDPCCPEAEIAVPTGAELQAQIVALTEQLEALQEQVDSIENP